MLDAQYHQLNGHEFEQTPGNSEGQGSRAHCSPWGCEELDMTVTEQQQRCHTGAVLDLKVRSRLI